MHMARRPSELPWIEALREARADPDRAALREPSAAAPRAGQVPLSRMDRRVAQHWITRGRALSAAAVLLALVAIAFLYLRYGTARTLTLSADRVVLSIVQAGDFLEYIPVTGNVQPRETVYLDAVD